MKTVVLDASVVLKWCLPSPAEPLVPQADQLLESYANGRLGFLAPDLLWAEVGNGLWKAVRRAEMPSAQATAAFDLLRQLRIARFRSSDLLPRALQIAILHDRSVYDSLYVALAVEASTELITADERLANALAARFPVKWLGAM